MLVAQIIILILLAAGTFWSFLDTCQRGVRVGNPEGWWDVAGFIAIFLLLWFAGTFSLILPQIHLGLS